MNKEYLLYSTLRIDQQMSSVTKTFVTKGTSTRPSDAEKIHVPWIPPGKNSTLGPSLSSSSFHEHSSKRLTHSLHIRPPRDHASEPKFSRFSQKLAHLLSEHEDEDRDRDGDEDGDGDGDGDEDGDEDRDRDRDRDGDGDEDGDGDGDEDRDEDGDGDGDGDEDGDEDGDVKRLNERIIQYKRKVDCLQTERGALKTEVEQQKQQLLDIWSEKMSVAKQVMVEQEEKMAQVIKKLEQTQEKNLLLRQAMEKMKEQTDGKRNDDTLLRKPKQVEVDGEEAAKQVSTEDILSKRMHRQVKLREKDQEATHLGVLLEVEKDKSMTSLNKSVSLETTQAHLQSQLLSQEAENRRLSVQNKTLEREAAQHKAEMETLRQQLSSDREALKQATTTLKHRAERSEEVASLLSIRLQKMLQEKQAAEAVSVAENWESRHTQTVQEKKKLEADLSLLRNRVEELKVQLHSTEERNRAKRKELLDELHKVNLESSAAKMKNHSLQIQLQEAQEKEPCKKRLSTDLRSSVMELIGKEESQSNNMELRQKNKLLMEENLQLQQAVEVLGRKRQQTSNQSNELLDLVIKRQESWACSVLSSKLQGAQSDAHQQVRGASTASASVLRNLCSTEVQITESREQTKARERSTVDKILDLETKLIQAEHQNLSRLQDVKDKLEKSDSTNRGLQNYVQLLKTSYANMFTDVILRVPSPL